MATLTEQVYQHATDNYESDGWDILVECHDKEEITQAIGKATTLAGALKKVQEEFGLVEHDAYRADIRGYGECDAEEAAHKADIKREAAAQARENEDQEFAANFDRNDEQSAYETPEYIQHCREGCMDRMEAHGGPTYDFPALWGDIPF